jgi:hypothetical protein
MWQATGVLIHCKLLFGGENVSAGISKHQTLAKNAESGSAQSINFLHTTSKCMAIIVVQSCTIFSILAPLV